MLKHISIKNYRNIIYLETEISPKGNILIAKNGSGKTNFVESIFYSTTGRSFRHFGSFDEFIGGEYNFSIVTTEWDEAQHLEAVTSKESKGIKRKFSINAKKTTNSVIQLKFPVVIFAPTSVDLVNGEPSLRRDDLDNYLALCYKEYSDALERYSYILKNRNAAIKQVGEGKSSKDSITQWSNMLAEYGNVINSIRKSFFAEINPVISKMINDFDLHLGSNQGTGLDVKMNFLPNIEDVEGDFKQIFLDKLTENLEKEIVVGKTLYGSHKDDYEINVNGRNLRFFGSRGQQRIGTFLIKIAQLWHYRNTHEKFPLLLLDDIMSELDAGNREKIARFLSENSLQFVLTSADTREVPELLLNGAQVINVSSE